MNKTDYCGITEKWVKATGGIKAAAILIQEAIKCSDSKAEKLAGRRYDRKVPHLEEIALKDLTMKRPKKSPSVTAEGASRAS